MHVYELENQTKFLMRRKWVQHNLYVWQTMIKEITLLTVIMQRNAGENGLTVLWTVSEKTIQKVHIHYIYIVIDVYVCT